MNISVVDTVYINDTLLSGLRINSPNYVSFANNSTLDLPAGGSGTWSMYAILTPLTAFSRNHVIFNIYFNYGTNNGLLYLYASSDGKPKVYFGNTVEAATTALTINKKTTIAVTHDGTYLRFYKDGALDRTVAKAQRPSGTATTGMFGSEWYTFNCSEALYDSVGIYKGKVLSLSEVQAIHNGAIPPPDNLSLYYNLNEGTGTTIYDRSGNSNNGTLGGSPLPTWVTQQVDVGINPLNISIVETETITELLEATNAIQKSASSSTTATEVVTVFYPYLTVNVKKNDRAGFSVHQNWLGYSDIDAEMLLLKKAKASWIRYEMLINNIEPAEGSFSWTKADYVYNLAASYDIQIIGLLSIHVVPIWARVDPAKDRADPTKYVQFVTDVATHFNDKIYIWEIGNEPNLRGFWGLDPPSSSTYTNEYVKPSYTALKGINPNNQVMIASLAPSLGPGDENYLTFTRAMFENGVKNYYDVMGFHPYVYPSAPNFNNANLIQAIMNEYGDGEKEQVFTEVGWNTSTVAGQGGVTEDVQATCLTQLFNLFATKSSGSRYRPIITWYDFREDINQTADKENHFGVVTNNLSRLKPAYYAFTNVSSGIIEETIPFETIIVLRNGARDIFISEFVTILDTRRNLIKNPSFEISGTWSDTGQIVLGTFPSSENTYSRSYVAKKSVAAGQWGSWGNYFSQIINVTAGRTYTFSAYGYIVSGATTNFNLYITFALTDWSAQYNSDTTIVTQGVWTRIYKTFVIPAGQTQIRVILNAGGGSATNATWYWDAVMLEEVSFLGDYFDGVINGGWEGSAESSMSYLPYLYIGQLWQQTIIEEENITELITIETTSPFNRNISKSDSCSITEEIVVHIPTLYINHSESQTITEIINGQYPGIIAQDSSTVSESITVQLEGLYISLVGNYYNQDFSGTSIPTGWAQTGNAVFSYDGNTVTESTVATTDPSKLLYTSDTHGQTRIVQLNITFNAIGGSDDRIGVTILGKSSNGYGINLILQNTAALRFLNDKVAWIGTYTLSPAPQVGETWTFKGMYRSNGYFYGKAWEVGNTEPDWQLTNAYTIDSTFAYSGICANSSSKTSKGSYDNFSIWDLSDASVIGESIITSTKRDIVLSEIAKVREGFSQSYSLNFANTQYVSVPDGTYVEPTAPYSIALWVKSTASGNLVLAEKDGNNGWSVQQTATTNRMQLVSQGFVGICGTLSINDGNWHHVILVMSSSSSERAIFIDGISDTLTTNAARSASYSTGVMYIGGRGATYTYPSNIAELMIFSNKAITSSEASNFYRYGNIPSGLIGRWKLNEGSGTAVVDITGNNANGTITNATWSTDVPQSLFVSIPSLCISTSDIITVGDFFYQSTWEISIFEEEITTESLSVSEPSLYISVYDIEKVEGYSVNFDGSGQKVVVAGATSPNLNFSTSFTLAAWISINAYKESSSDYMAFVGRGRASVTTYSYIICLNKSDPGPRTFICALYNGSSNPNPQSTTVPALNTWYHVAMTYDGSSLKVYVNGLKENEASTNINVSSASQEFTIGKWPNTLSYPGNAKVDDVRAYSRPLSSNEIYDLSHGNDVSSTGLVAWYQMNEGSGTTITDLSGSGYDGTITDATYSTDTPPTLHISRANLPFSVTPDSTTVTESITIRRNQFNISVSDSTRVFEGIDYKYGTSLYFNGSSANVASMTMDFTRTAGQPMSAGAWFKLGYTSPGTAQTMFGVRTGSSAGDLWKIGIESTGYLSVDYDTVGGGEKVNTLTSYYDNSWHHTAFTYDGSYIRIYVDGLLKSTGNLKTTAAIDQTAFAIGKRADATEYYTGFVDEVFISNQALSDAEILTIYQGIYDTSKLNHLWKLNEGTGTSAADSIGSLNGTVTGATWSTDVPTNMWFTTQTYLQLYESETATESFTIIEPNIYIEKYEETTAVESVSLFRSEGTLFVSVQGRIWGVKIL